MSSSSKFLLAGFVLITLCSLTGCMANKPNDTDMPWSAPSSWEGTMPLPGSMSDRFQ